VQERSENKNLGIFAIISNPTGWIKDNTAGGGEMRAVEILKCWHRWKISIETFEPHHSPSLLKGAAYRINITKIIKANNRNILIAILNFLILSVSFAYKGFIRRKCVDVIIASNSNFSDVGPAWLLSKILRKPFIVIFQSLAYGINFKDTFKLIKEQNINKNKFALFLIACTAGIMLRLTKDARSIFCSSKALENMLIRIGFAKERIFVTAAGVDFNLISNIKCDRKEFDAAFLGRVETNKGIKDLLEAWGSVVKEKSNARLLIIGTGSFLSKAKIYSEELNLRDNVIFPGPVYTQEKFRYLKMSRIFVFPSFTEGWSLSVIEAMACGLPVLGYDIPFFKEISKDCKSVITVPKGDSERLTGEILNFLNKEGLLREYSKISMDFAERYDWNKIAKRELEFVKESTK